MKKIIVLSLALVLLANIGIAQNNQALKPLLEKYYAVKESLISGDVKTSSGNAATFIATLKAIDAKQVSQAAQKQLSAMLPYAQQIAQANDIAKQRDAFSGLSGSMLILVKAENIAGSVIYLDYCPMKKAYWLSDSKIIRNPYYGNSMLTCGEIKETIKP